MTDVLILDQPTVRTPSSLNYTPTVGSKWAVIYVAERNSSGNAQSPASVTLGGVTAQLIAGESLRTQDRSVSSVWAINETAISSMVGDAIVVTGGSGTLIVITFSIQGDVKQTIPTRKSFVSSELSLVTRSTTLAQDIGGLTFHAHHRNLLGQSATMFPTLTFNGSDAGSTYSIGVETTSSTKTEVSWSSANTSSVSSYIAVHFEKIPPYLISSVNNDTNILVANSTNTAQVVGFSPISGTLGNLTLTNVSTTDNVTTFTIPWIVDGLVYPEFGVPQILTLTDGTNVSTLTVPFIPPSSYGVIELLNPDNIDEYKLGKFISDDGILPTSLDKIIYTTTQILVLSDTSVDIPVLPITTTLYFWSNTTGKAYQFITTINSTGTIIGSVITLPLFNNGIGGGISYDPASPPNGALFKIIGSGFGVKQGYTDHIDTSGIYDLPESTQFGTVGRRSGVNYIGASNRPVVKSEGLANSKCVYFFQEPNGTPGRAPNNVLPFYFDTPLGLGETYFCSRWTKHVSPNSPNGGQRKFDRWQASLASVSDKASENYLSGTRFPNRTGEDAFKIQVRDFDDGTGGVVVYGAHQPTLFDSNKWVRYDILHKMPTTLGGTDYSCEFWVHDADGILPPSHNVFTQDGKYPAPYLQTEDFWRMHVPQNYLGYDGHPSISVQNVNVLESTGTATIWVRLSSSALTTITVNYSTVNGTAIAGSDYTATNGTLSFAVGDFEKSFVVPITADGLSEGREVFYIVLSNPDDANIDIGTGTCTIIDDNTPLITNPYAVEGSNLVFNVSLSAPTSGITNMAFSVGSTNVTLNVEYSDPVFSDGITVSGNDLVIPSGISTFTVTIPLIDDVLYENTKSITLTILNGVGVGLIHDNDGRGGYTQGYHHVWEQGYYESLGSADRVELTNNANYALSTRCFIQPVNDLTWSDTSIDILKLNRGDIVGNAWLHVIRNNIAIHSQAI